MPHLDALTPALRRSTLRCALSSRRSPTLHRQSAPGGLQSVDLRLPTARQGLPHWLPRLVLVVAATVALIVAAPTARAHEPVVRCVQLDPDQVRCRGASNDGDEMPGSPIEVLAHDNTSLLVGKLATNSTFTFRRPAQPFYVLFDTGPGLQVTVEQDEILPLPSPARRARWMQP